MTEAYIVKFGESKKYLMMYFSGCCLLLRFNISMTILSSGRVVKLTHSLPGTQLQNIATRMAEAVVKFELLSNDPSSVVCVVS